MAKSLVKHLFRAYSERMTGNCQELVADEIFHRQCICHRVFHPYAQSIHDMSVVITEQ
jgi:hypothetical protein